MSFDSRHYEKTESYYDSNKTVEKELPKPKPLIEPHTLGIPNIEGFSYGSVGTPEQHLSSNIFNIVDELLPSCDFKDKILVCCCIAKALGNENVYKTHLRINDIEKPIVDLYNDLMEMSDGRYY